MTVERTFVIVDLAGFSAATEAHGDETAADLATQLTGLATEALGPRDQLVKSLGDAVLCACVGIEVVELGAYSLRNIADETNLFELVVDTGDVTDVVDPVCRMRIQRNHAPGRLRYDGVEYWFCSLDCAAAFATSPRRHLDASDEVTS
ncbi:MAG TPA: YHS domain-containing protein [Acidimicrobiia bacterium]|nr:YHS domain-containing protein [Acidimicrobiia bacterium]